MRELKVTWLKAARIWWSWTWQSLVITILLAVSIGLLIGFVMLAIHVPIGPYMLYFKIAAVLIALVVSIGVMKRIFINGFSRYRIVLLDRIDLRK